MIRTFVDSGALIAAATPTSNHTPIIGIALDLASQFGLSGMDALHLAAARAMNADEFVTTERPVRDRARPDVGTPTNPMTFERRDTTTRSPSPVPDEPSPVEALYDRIPDTPEPLGVPQVQRTARSFGLWE